MKFRVPQQVEDFLTIYVTVSKVTLYRWILSYAPLMCTTMTTV